MKCPSCNETLLMSDKNGVEIDYCPSCRGIWLDRGELDKILERANEHYSHKENYRPDYRDSDYDRRDYRSDRSGRPYRKKKSFFGDFFDFD